MKVFAPNNPVEIAATMAAWDAYRWNLAVLPLQEGLVRRGENAKKERNIIWNTKGLLLHDGEMLETPVLVLDVEILSTQVETVMTPEPVGESAVYLLSATLSLP